MPVKERNVLPHSFLKAVRIDCAAGRSHVLWHVNVVMCTRVKQFFSKHNIDSGVASNARLGILLDSL